MERILFTKYSERDIKLPFVLHALGLNHVQEFIHRPAGIPLYQWVQCVKGSGILVIDDKPVAVEEGMGMLLLPRQGHKYYATNREWTVHYIVFTGYGVQELFQQMGIEHSAVYHMSNGAQLTSLLEEMYALYTGQEEMMKMLPLSGSLYSLLLELIKFSGSSNESRLSARNPKIQMVIEHINNYYMEPIQLADLAEIAQLSKEYLCQLFKKVTGLTIKDYLIDVRISRSKVYLIRDRTERINQISRRCGFDDVSYFGAVFKKREGMTPAKFREQYQ